MLVECFLNMLTGGYVQAKVLSTFIHNFDLRVIFLLKVPTETLVRLVKPPLGQRVTKKDEVWGLL